MRKILVWVMTSLSVLRTHARTYTVSTLRLPLYVSHCEMPHSTCVGTRIFFFRREVASPTALREKKAKHYFEDDKIHIQFMRPTAEKRARRLVMGETNRLAHHQNLEVKSFSSVLVLRNVGFFLLK